MQVNQHFSLLPDVFVYLILIDKHFSTPDALPCDKVFELDADHAPFTSQDQQLTKHLLAL